MTEAKFLSLSDHNLKSKYIRDRRVEEREEKEEGEKEEQEKEEEERMWSLSKGTEGGLLLHSNDA